MSSEHWLAPAPGGEDLAENGRRMRPRRALVMRGASLLLLLSVGCSRVVPSAPPAERRTEHPGVANVANVASATSTSTSGTPPVAVPEPRKEAEAPASPVAGPSPTATALDHAATTSASPVDALRSAPAPAPYPAKEKPAAKRMAPMATSKAIGDSFGAGGLGLSGIGAGGGGLGVAQSVRGAPTGSGVAMGYGQGHGRLGGAHLARPAHAALVPQRPDEASDMESYSPVHDNPFHLVTDAPLSTFSVDVDTASYSNMRRFVAEGRLPPADSIRVEEWVNYFGYDDPTPHGDEPVSVTSELTECPWAPGHQLLRVALATEPIAQADVPPRNLVFLVDVSGSMQPANKLPLLKRGLAMLARQLRPVDTVSIVVYAGASGLALPPTSGANQGKILAALESLESGGSTNGAEGIRLAYQMAEAQMRRGGINRVVLATDGDFNVGTTSEGELERLITEKRKSGVFLTVLGFGEGNVKDSTMEMLADKGNYAYVDSLAEARKVLVHEAGATLVTVAQDVKLQVEFNPTHVSSYRLVGYENRVLADRDFNDDTKDAGEMGAGHHVTAFYELVPVARAEAAPAEVDPLKYQTGRAPGAAAASNELATVKIRYKAPGGTKSLLMSRAVQDRLVPLPSASESLRFGAAVAEYALSLRGAPGLGVQHLAGARALATAAVGTDPRGERREFLALMARAAALPRQ
jgi:Ca-activated chloride channel homolog